MIKACEFRRIPPAWGGLQCLLICLLAFGAGNALAAQGGVGGGGGGGGNQGGGRIFAPSPLVPAAPVPPVFDITGFIQEATLDSAGAICQASDPRLAGGTISINDILVIVPCNTVLQMPAATLTWQELFSLAPRDIGLPLGANGIPTQTGLALKDSVTMPMTTPHSNGRLPSYEAHVIGNVVNGRYIAGLVFISQQNLNFGQGTITAIDYHNGELQIAHAGPPPGITRVKINDPLGRFGLAHGAPGSGAALIDPTYDQRFSVDSESATVHAATGYPMCIPRSDPFFDADDPLCPQSNRPRSPDCASLPAPFPAFTMPAEGQFCRTFMMPPPPSSACTPAVGVSCPPDARQQAPFEVGDTIVFQGTLKFDSKGPYISAHTIENSAGIYTSPGVMPAYAMIEMELQGTASLPVANLPQESTSRVKVIGFTTDPSNLVDIYAIDVHPVTGATTDRLIGIANPSGPPVVGRFRFQPPAGAFMPPTREFRVVSRTMCGTEYMPCAMTAAPQTYANGLIAGQYHAPNFEFIFAENLILGDPIVSANLQDFVFLYCGSGPLTTPTGGTTAPVVGQLDPAPWAAPMYDPMFVVTLCPGAKRMGGGTGGATAPPTKLAPIAIAVATPMSATYGQTISLSALTSSDPNKPVRPLTGLWTQTSGPAVVLTGADSATPSFSVPKVKVATAFSFNLKVTNTVPLSSSADVSVTVVPPSPLPTLSLNAPGMVTPGSVVAMMGMVSSGTTFKWTQTAGPLVTLNAGASLSPNFTAPLTPTSITFALTATTAAGASATMSRTIVISADTVAIAPVTWDNRQGKGKLTVVATSNAITGDTPPAGLSMTLTMWSEGVDAGLPGSASSPMTVPMSVVTNVFGQTPVCPNAMPCFVAPLVSVLASQASPGSVAVFWPPTMIVVKSSWGGMATLTDAAIKIIQ